MEWTEELKANLIKAYKDAEPTPETSTEIVADLAEEFDTTVNGARAILVRAKVYVNKADAKASGKAASSAEKKETKAESLERLTGVIEALGLDADDTIVSKLTGKAAAYFADVIDKATDPEG